MPTRSATTSAPGCWRRSSATTPATAASRPEDVEWVIVCTKLRATGMPIRRIREYAELVRDGDGNEADRLALLEAHREDVVCRLNDVQRNLELVDYKIGLYREFLAIGRSKAA